MDIKEMFTEFSSKNELMVY